MNVCSGGQRASKRSRKCSCFVLTGRIPGDWWSSPGMNLPSAAAPAAPKPSSALASSRVLIPAPTRICRVCACCKGSTASSPTQTNSRPGFHADLDHMVERALEPALERYEPFLGRLHAQRLARRPVDLRYERGGRNRECVADDARQPLVVLVFQRRLAVIISRVRRHL
jgi:hypothetical protein